jgi:urease accessory protein
VNVPAEKLRSSTFLPGHGRLGIENVAGKSAVTTAWASSPLKLLVPRPRGESVWAYLASFGGGLVAGDETQFSIHVGAGCKVFVGTQASTKVYRNPLALPCGHRLTAEIDQDSLLILAPDVIQSFAGSSYTQRQEFRLQNGGGLVLVDWFCSGRAARGERWAFSQFRSRNEIFVNGERLLVDSLLLDPADGPFDSPHRLGRFNCVALVVVIGDPFRDLSGQILAAAEKEPIHRRASLISSASAIQGGMLLRIAGERVEDVGLEIRRRLEPLGAILQDDPWARKW